MSARKQQNGKQLTCLSLSRCHFLLALYPSLLVCRPPLHWTKSILKGFPSSDGIWHWISSVSPRRQFPWRLPRGSSPYLASPLPPAEVSTSRFLPPCCFTCCFPRACEGPCSGRGSPPVSTPLWATGQSLRPVWWRPFLLKREAAWGPRKCPPHIRGQGLLIFVMNLPQQIPRDVLSHQRLILALLRHFYFTLRGISVLSNLWNVIFFFCKFSNLLQSSPTFFFFSASVVWF